MRAGRNLSMVCILRKGDLDGPEFVFKDASEDEKYSGVLSPLSQRCLMQTLPDVCGMPSNGTSYNISRPKQVMVEIHKSSLPRRSKFISEPPREPT